MEDNLSERGNLVLGLLPLLSLGQAYYVPRNDIIIVVITCYLSLITYHLLLLVLLLITYYSLLVTYHSLLVLLLITCYLSCYSLLITYHFFLYLP
jgi:hypothetical protein